jgi:hypothetical protein
MESDGPLNSSSTYGPRYCDYGNRETRLYMKYLITPTRRPTTRNSSRGSDDVILYKSSSQHQNVARGSTRNWMTNFRKTYNTFEYGYIW